MHRNIHCDKYSVETMSYYADTGGHKMFKFIKEVLTSIQKASVAAHFARLGQRDRANDIIAR